MMNFKVRTIFLSLFFALFLGIFLFGNQNVYANDTITLKEVNSTTFGYTIGGEHQIEKDPNKTLYITRRYSNFVVSTNFQADIIKVESDNTNIVKVEKRCLGITDSLTVPNGYCFKVTDESGVAHITVYAENSNQKKSFIKTYTVYSYDVVSQLKIENQQILVSKSKDIDVSGVNLHNYFSGTYTPVILNINNCTYTAEDTGVVSINPSGHMIGLKPGKTKVSLKYEQQYYSKILNPQTNEFCDYTADACYTTFYVYVNEEITGMDFKDKEIILNKGDKYCQSPINYPEGSHTSKIYTWSSSDKNVATVNKNGEIFCNNTGVTVITAKATDDSEKEASFKIYVKADKPSGIKAVSKTKYINVTWDDMEWIESYKIYRSTDKNGSYDLIGESSSSFFNDKTAKYNTKYYYKISVVPKCSYKCESLLSEPVSFCLKIEKPKIKSVKKHGAGYRIKIKGKKYNGFVIYIGKKKNPKKAVAVIKGKNATIYLKKKKKYYIRCRAYAKVGNKNIYSSYSKSKKYYVK